MAKEGKTVYSELELKPGSNAAVAVAPPSEMLPAVRIEQLATELATVFDAIPVPAGQRLGYRFFEIGPARPTVLREMGTSKSLRRWYDKTGAPVGDDPIFFSVNIDWRGQARKFKWPAGIFVFPSSARVVHGEANWPNLRAPQMASYLETTDIQEKVSTIGRQTSRHIQRVVNPALTAAVTIGAAALGLWIVSNAAARGFSSE